MFMINVQGKEGLGHAIYNGPLREQFHPLIITGPKLNTVA